MQRSDSAAVASSSGTRLLVADVLRGIAIVAMVIAHAAPFVPSRPGVLSFVTSMFSEMASPLFALVMGLSAQLVWNRRPRVATTLPSRHCAGCS